MVKVVHKRRNQWTSRWEGVPVGQRPCSKCKSNKPLTEFHNAKHGAFGKGSVCKTCYGPIGKANHEKRSLPRRMLDTARSRAKQKGYDCNIDETDIVVPEFCPVLGVKLESSRSLENVNTKGFRKDNSPSLDRIDSKKGYVKGNVRVISLRANLLKSNSTLEEARAIVRDLERIEAERKEEQ